MKLEAISAEIRPRSAWEAVDLGWALARRHYARILRFWLVAVVPIWALILGFLHDRLFLAMVLIWWLKPIYERVPLFVLSRSLFGNPPGGRDLLRNWPRLMLGQLPQTLIIRRLSAHRTLVLPVAELENLRGRDFFDRAKILSLRSGGSAFTEQLAGLLMLHSVWLGIILMVYLMIPPQLQPSFELMGDGLEVFLAALPRFFVWIWIGLYLLALTLIAPFDVGGGFGLYLNTRSEIEGWDVELAFRRLSNRLLTAGAVAAAAVLLSMPVMTAQEAESTESADAATPKEVIEKILAHEDFKIHTESRVVGYEGGGLPWLWDGGFVAAEILRFALIAIGVAFLAILLVRAIQAWVRTLDLPDAPVVPKAKTVMGMNVRPESLPRDIVKQARSLWEGGRFHEAVSLLYRGAISWLIEQENVPILESDTEHECLQRSQATAKPGAAAYFNQLTGAWVAVAYGKRRPTDAQAGQLFENWPFPAR